MGLTDQAEGLAAFTLPFDTEVEPLASALGTLRRKPVEGVHELLLGAAPSEEIHHRYGN